MPVDPLVLVVDTSFALSDVADELQRARAKFPAAEHTLVATGEEFGEMCQAFLHHKEGNADALSVYQECIQVAAMAIRCATEGDAAFPYAPPPNLREH